MTLTQGAAPAEAGAAGALPQYTIPLPAGIKLINANQSLHFRKKAELVKAIRTAAHLITRSLKVPHMDRVHVCFVIHPNPSERRRDPANWAPSAKAAIDGMVEAGALDDDDSTRLLGGDPRLGTPVKGSQLVLVVTDLTAAPAWLLEVLDPTRQLAPNGDAA